MTTEQQYPADWLQKSIKELGEGSPQVVQTGPFGAQLHSSDYVEDGIPLILIKNITDSGLDETDIPRITIQDAQRLKQYALKPGDVVFSRVGRVGSCFLVQEEQRGWIISGQLLRIRLPEEAIDRYYLIHALRDRHAQDQILNASVGSTRQSINTSILENLRLLIPNNSDEQALIAAILDTIDDTLRYTEQAIAKLKSVGAGLLHDLLTYGIDENGDLRDPTRHPEQFKESELGLIPREWEVSKIEDKLEQIIDYRGKTPIKADFGVPLITAKNVREGYIDQEPREYISESTYDTRMVRGIPKPGDVFFTTEAPLGNVARVPNYKLSPGQSLLTLVPYSKLLDAGYLFWVLQSPSSRQRIYQKSTGSTVLGIKQSVFRKIAFAFPQWKEQNQIAHILDTQQDATVSAEAQVTKLRLLKRGLMDDLPTGRVRVVDLLNPEG